MINPLLKFRTMGVPPQKLDQTVQANPALMQSALGRLPVDPSILGQQEQDGGMDNMAMMLAMQNMQGNNPFANLKGKDEMFPAPVRQMFAGAPGEQTMNPGQIGYVPSGTTLNPFEQNLFPGEAPIPGLYNAMPYDMSGQLMPAQPGLLSNLFKKP